MPMRPLELPKVKRVRVEPPPRATRRHPKQHGMVLRSARRDPPALPSLGLMADCEI